ncbi:unnamed protein product [Blepharisma stoltei]|uniref:Pleiotropic regulator 1 n=1 Tax=Blepharisma stoltei TaxID=1481888 RepID=A0AAU9IKU1_9CILI|nr:unnamed protein product [Blepharisma stoltei]
MEDLVTENLKRTYCLFAANQGARVKRPRDIDILVNDTKSRSFYKGIPDVVEEVIKKRKIEEKKLENPSYNPNTDIDSLKALLSRREEESKSSQLAIFQDKHLNLRLKTIEPVWHPQWKLMRVISGHQGWVRCITVDPTNSWFATGSNDRMIKIWDLASGQLKLSLVGHINAVRDLVASDRHSYLFSCSEDKTINCWDLEYNKIIRHYHGHLNGVYSLSIHPTLDLLFSTSRDCTCRVWDIRTKAQVMVLEGHTGTVWDVASQAPEPQIITGSADTFIKLWDLSTGRCMNTLTRHKKAIRAVKFHHEDYAFISAAADNLKLWKCPEGEFLRNFPGNGSIINDIAINEDNVLVTGGDDGVLSFWDYSSGYNFQNIQTQVQPGSLSCEAGIFATCFDRSGLRLITAECDKTIKIYKEDENSSISSHPIPPEAKVFIKPKY